MDQELHNEVYKMNDKNIDEVCGTERINSSTINSDDSEHKVSIIKR